MNGVWTMPVYAKSFLQRACIWKPVTRIPSAISIAKGISYNDFKLSWIYSAKSASMDVQLFTDCGDSPLQLDTIFFTVKQDTARNEGARWCHKFGPKNPQFVFRSN